VFVTRSDRRLFSFYEKREELEGWLDTMYYSDAHTFDVKTGRELRFEDVFEITDELPTLLYEELTDAYPDLSFAEETPDIIGDAIRENNTAVVSFSLAPGCVHVLFADYRFTSQHTGGHHITLSFADYPHIIKPEWQTVPYSQMFRMDFGVDYYLVGDLKLRMEFVPIEDGICGEWSCRVRNSEGAGQSNEHKETFCNAPFEVYLIRENGRQLLYLSVPTGDVSALTNVYEITACGISYIGQTDCAIYETVTLDPARIPMMRFEEREDAELPVPVYGICRVGDDGMPVWLETIKD